LRQYSFAKKTQSQTVSKENTLIQKAAHKMLVKLTPAVNFINVKRANFLFKSSFKGQNVSRKKDVRTKKCVRLMLMKLTPGGSNQFGKSS